MEYYFKASFFTIYYSCTLYKMLFSYGKRGYFIQGAVYEWPSSPVGNAATQFQFLMPFNSPISKYLSCPFRFQILTVICRLHSHHQSFNLEKLAQTLCTLNILYTPFRHTAAKNSLMKLGYLPLNKEILTWCLFSLLSVHSGFLFPEFPKSLSAFVTA